MLERKEKSFFENMSWIFIGNVAHAVLSFLINDSKIALVSAICGILYTIFAGKGKISCYAFGLCGTLCYSYLSFVNNLFGNLALYMLYYLTIQIVLIFRLKQHLKK